MKTMFEDFIDAWDNLWKTATEPINKFIERLFNKMIKDSGNRREFSSGALRDMQDGKGRFDLLPWMAIWEVAKHCENGAKKYGEHNVDKGIPTHSFIDSAFRHLAKHTDGQTDEPHLIAAAWNILWAIQTEIKHPELKDIPWKDDGGEN
jgi:hypothetical protein